nr:putative SWI/SNF-related matrix-associated actin-dependent regulator of chromatin subfamily A member 3-like 3 isoform X2 [Ipomoea trifida]
MGERKLGSRSLTVQASFKEGKTARRGASVRPSLDADEFINLLHGSDPMKMDLNRLENEVRGQLDIKGALPSFGFLFLDKQQIERLSNRNIGTIANDIVQVPITVGGAMLMDRSGRRPLLMRPYENGDQRAILRSLMLKRTKETKDKEGRPILVLPPTDIQVIECEQSEVEHNFYDALYKKSLPGSGKKFSS